MFVMIIVYIIHNENPFVVTVFCSIFFLRILNYLVTLQLESNI